MLWTRNAMAVAVAGLTVGAAAAQTGFSRQHLIANREGFDAELVDPLLVNAWGMARTSPGLGGDLWISNAGTGTSTAYIGDVNGQPISLHHPGSITIPSTELWAHFPDTISQPTGQRFNASDTDFIVSNGIATAPAQFIFCSFDGSVSGWAPGMTSSVNMVDDSASGTMYSGFAITDFPSNNLIFAANFNKERLDIFDHNWQPVQTSATFRDPAVSLIASWFNLLWHDGVLYVAWAHIGDEPAEEDSFPGYGYVSAFDIQGNLLASYEHTLGLNAPWGLAVAPDDFGKFGGALLVGNFGSGEILAYDRQTHQFIDYLRDEAGEPIVIDGLWDLLFGNGETFGEFNHLYFTAGPNMETDGLLGKLVAIDFCEGDLNRDGAVDDADLGILLNDYGCHKGACAGDVSVDGDTDDADLGLLPGAFGNPCDVR